MACIDWLILVIGDGDYILRSQFHLQHCSQQTLTEIVSRITPNLGLTCPLINIQNPNRADSPVTVTVCIMMVTFILSDISYD